MSDPPPAVHPQSDDWDFLTDHFLSSLSPPPPSNPFLSVSPPSGPHLSASSNPFLSPPPGPHSSASPNPFLSPSSPSATSASSNPFLSPPSGLHTSASLPAGPGSAPGPHRSASLYFSPSPPAGHGSSAPLPHRSASLSNSSYFTPPSSPPLAFSSPSDASKWAAPAGAVHDGSLSEFSGRASQDPIFKPVTRCTVDQTRPVPLTLRPRPARESQQGFSLRSLVFFPPCYLFAAQESGLRVWNLQNLFDQSVESNRNVKRGDDETVPFVESRRTSCVMCMAVDAPRGVVWSGHVDGRITGWRVNGSGLVNGFEECLLWEAHQRAPVLSLALTPYGELWSGSEAGIIKVWSTEAIKKSLSLPKEEKRKAAFLLEQSCVDLRNLVTENGACPVPTVDVKILMCDNNGAKVWAGGYLNLILWDCRTKELIKVMSSIDGSVETRFDSPDPTFPSDPSKKEKSRNSPNFFQRSKNALLGAADAVRRVAVKAAFGDDVRRVESIATSADNRVWIGGSNGSVSQWDPNGSKLQEFIRNSASVLCIYTYGTRVWVGYSDGKIQVMDLEGKLMSSWLAHKSPVLKITMGANYVFTLANHGGIRAWSLASPGPTDGIIRAELAERESRYKREKHVKMVFGTWNVGQEKAVSESIKKWIGVEVKEGIGLVVVGLQEVDMGAGFLAIAAAKETVGLEGTLSPNGEGWLATIGRVLGVDFDRVSCRQMAGLLIAVWARKSLKQYVTDLESAVVACGLGRAIGNKGAVGLKMRIYGRIMCFVNCHLAAHLEAVNRRNEDFDHIYRTMTFAPPAGSSNGPLFRGANLMNNRKPDLSESDLVVFLGDFNYRLDNITYEEAKDLIYREKFDKLRAKDQLRAEMKNGRVFQGLREAQINFPATYKFDKYVSGLSGYDSSEKKRIPAWCDRILYRDSRTISGAQKCSLDCPVVSSVSLYDACMEVIDSDHKPVKCVLNVDISYVDESIRRQEYGQIISSNKKIKSLFDEFKILPEISLSTNNLTLKNQEISVLRVSNMSRNEKGSFEIFCGDFLNGGENKRVVFPKWLKVNPASGIIQPGQTVEINVQHGDLYGQDFYEGYSNRKNEENQEKNVILIFKITNNFSNEAKIFKVNINHIGSRGIASKNVMYGGGSQIW